MGAFDVVLRDAADRWVRAEFKRLYGRDLDWCGFCGVTHPPLDDCPPITPRPLRGLASFMETR